MLLWTSYGGLSMCPDRGRRRAMLTEGSKQMASKESSLLVLTTSPCVDTGDVGSLLWAVVFDAILSVMFDKNTQ